MKRCCSTLAALVMALGVSTLSAVTVTTLHDSGPGSLRAALEAGGEIEFAVTGTIALTSGELVVSHATTLTGPGAGQLTIARSDAPGTPEFRVFRVADVNATISGLTIGNGLVASNYSNGAGVLNQGSLTLNDCVVRGNRSTSDYARGTGLFNANEATLTANRCVFAENVGTGEYAEGGGIYVFGVVTLNDCTIRGNRGEGYYSRGGGLHVDYFGRAGVARCTFSGNSVTGLNSQGGGIYNYGRLEIVNSTLSGNHSGETGGGMHVDALAPNTAIRNCTISGNTARTGGAGLANYGFAPHSNGPRTVKDSIIAGNEPGDIESTGVIASLGHNLFGEVSGHAIAAATGDHFNVTADALKLAPLATNGGATKTRALLAGSLAIDAGNPGTFPDIDQRGVARPFGPRPDIGAFELDVILPPVVTVSATRSNTMEAGPTVFVAPGEFTIYRSGSTNESLQVFFRLSGTASNGVDYLHVSNSVVIPAGNTSARVTILGLFDGLVEGTETVVLHLEELACPAIYPPPPGCYTVGKPAEAVVKIQDYEQPTNQPPTVSIVSPTNGAVFIAPAEIRICADARDADGYVDFVEFFAGTNRLGSRTNCLPCAAIQNPYCLVWTNPPPGEHVLTAKVTDNRGATAVSGPVHISVREAGSNPLSFRLAFNNPSGNGGVFFRDYTENGPAEGTRLLPADRVVTDSRGRYYFGAKPHRVWRVDKETGAVVDLPSDPDSPEISWPMGVASDLNRIVLATLGGEGFFYFYDPVHNVWNPDSVTSLNNVDLDCLEYHHYEDSFYGISVTWAGSAPRLHRFGGDGTPHGDVALPVLPFVIGPTAYRSELVSVDHQLVLLLEADLALDPYGESRMYLVDPYTGETQLLWRHERPRPNFPPLVQINSPANGQLFPAPANVPLVAYAQDPEDGYDVTVEFFAGTNSLGLGTFVPSLCPTPFCPNFSLTWSNVPPGQYTLTAHARDPNGNVKVSAPVTILVHDPALPVVTVRATDASAGEAGNPGEFTIYRDGNTNHGVHVFFTLGGMASNGVDYVEVGPSVFLAAGVRSATVPIIPILDGLNEGKEWVELRLVPPPFDAETYVIGSPSSALVSIADYELPELPIVTITAPHPNASETPGHPGLFLVHRTGPTNHSLTVFWEIGGTATPGVDYATLSNQVVIPAGRSFVRIAVVPIDDDLVEGPETVSATLYYPPFAGPFPPSYIVGSPSNAVVTIHDNDPFEPPPFEPAVVTIEATDPHARETGPLTVIDPGEFTIRRSGNTNVTLHVYCAISGTASNGVDYLTLSNVVVIPAGVTAVHVPVYPLNDDLAEGTETVTLRLVVPLCIAIYPPPPECYQVGSPEAATVFIHDFGAPSPRPVVTITARDSIASEGTNCFHWVGWSNPPPADYCGTNTATFIVRRHGPTNAALSVWYAIRGTASNGVDYAELPGFVTIPAGRRAAEIIIVPVDDDLPERHETVVLALRGPPISPEVLPAYTVGTPHRAGAVIVDNDRPRPVSGPLWDHGFHFTQPGTNGAWYRVETSADLIHWTALVTNVVTDGAIHFVDPDADDAPARFYRAVPETNPPLE